MFAVKIENDYNDNSQKGECNPQLTGLQDS